MFPLKYSAHNNYYKPLCVQQMKLFRDSIIWCTHWAVTIIGASLSGPHNGIHMRKFCLYVWYVRAFTALRRSIYIQRPHTIGTGWTVADIREHKFVAISRAQSNLLNQQKRFADLGARAEETDKRNPLKQRDNVNRDRAKHAACYYSINLYIE